MSHNILDIQRIGKRKAWYRLAEIKTIAHSGDRNKAILELVRDTGASGCGRDMPSTGERDTINISSIHQALQTNISFEGMQNGVTGLYEG